MYYCVKCIPCNQDEYIFSSLSFGIHLSLKYENCTTFGPKIMHHEDFIRKINLETFITTESKKIMLFFPHSLPNLIEISYMLQKIYFHWFICLFTHSLIYPFTHSLLYPFINSTLYLTIIK